VIVCHNCGGYNEFVAQGEADRTGGNIEGSGATYSCIASYRPGKSVLTSAYERYNGVNRTSDVANSDRVSLTMRGP